MNSLQQRHEVRLRGLPASVRRGSRTRKKPPPDRDVAFGCDEGAGAKRPRSLSCSSGEGQPRSGRVRAAVHATPAPLPRGVVDWGCKYLHLPVTPPRGIAMKKLSLDIGALRVESFDVSRDGGAARGTVRAN